MSDWKTTAAAVGTGMSYIAANWNGDWKTFLVGAGIALVGALAKDRGK